MTASVAIPAPSHALRTRAVLPCFLLGALVFGLAVGCKPSPFQYVEGLVTLDGVPVEGATVTFRPQEKGGMMAAGITDAQGIYRLNPLQGKRGAGAMVGDFDVTIIKARDPGEGGRREDLTGKVEYITPPAYADAAMSGLKATIKPGRNTGPDVSFELKSDFKKK
jgi:hypothetical protein